MAGRSVSALRSRGTVALVTLLGTALIVGSAFVPWWRRRYDDPLSGPKTITLDGATLSAALVPLAVAALAAWAASTMVRGLGKRVLGACVLLLGAGAIIVAVVLGAEVPDAAFHTALIRPAVAVGPPGRVLVGLLLAAAGGMAVALAGVVLLLSAPLEQPRARSPQAAAARSSGYDAHHSPAARRAAARREAQAALGGAEAGCGAEPAQIDPEQLWRSLDVGVDLTGDVRGAPSTGVDSATHVPGHRHPSAPDTMGTPAAPRSPNVSRSPEDEENPR